MRLIEVCRVNTKVVTEVVFACLCIRKLLCMKRDKSRSCSKPYQLGASAKHSTDVTEFMEPWVQLVTYLES